jgi:RND superfamily putative drug exporter
VLLSFVLLTLVFRSLVVPLKAALLNLLSIGAAYGVVVMVFQWEWGGGLIGLESTLPVEPFIPVFMFAILFGLSMDYRYSCSPACASTTWSRTTTRTR